MRILLIIAWIFSLFWAINKGMEIQRNDTPYNQCLEEGARAVQQMCNQQPKGNGI